MGRKLRRQTRNAKLIFTTLLMLLLWAVWFHSVIND